MSKLKIDLTIEIFLVNQQFFFLKNSKSTINIGYTSKMNNSNITNLIN